jgi:glycosyltransferase involved in cell wall biosynthesis
MALQTKRGKQMGQITGGTVCLLFRKPGRFFSIERIFQQLEPLLSQYVTITCWKAAYAEFVPHKLLSNIWAAKKYTADIYHVTGDIHYVVIGLPRRRTLLTIHDCVFLYTATGIKRRLLKWLLLDIPVRRCRLITTISEATKSDILRHTGCSPEKLVVIPDPIAGSIYYVPAIFNELQPVILFVGTTSNKNLPLTAAALKNISCRMDIIGILSAEQQQALDDNGILYRLYSGLSDQEMAARYAEADIVFSLPPSKGSACLLSKDRQREDRSLPATSARCARRQATQRVSSIHATPPPSGMEY